MTHVDQSAIQSLIVDNHRCEEVGWNGSGIHNRINWCKFQFLSLDTPNDSGDHENYFAIDREENKIYDIDGKRYDSCVKKAVHIREIETQIPWHSITDFTLVFSNLSSSNFMSVDHSNLLLDLKSSKIKFTKAVDSSYG